jgi:hypothetical protein
LPRLRLTFLRGRRNREGEHNDDEDTCSTPYQPSRILSFQRFVLVAPVLTSAAFI